MKIVHLLLLIVPLLLSCEKEEKDFDALIRGTWINTEIDGTPVLTDETFVLSFRSDGTELYAKGFNIDENNRSWIENSAYTYSVRGNTLVIDGTDVDHHVYHMEFLIESLSATSLSYTVKTFSIDQTDYPDTKKYTCRKAAANYSSAFAGVWYGRCTTDGAADTQYHYWEYFPDGSFHYYYQNENLEWVKKSDNDGGYFLYGNLFVSNYSNDLLLGGTGKAFECWNFSISGNQMTWTGFREENQTVTYQMERVESAPETTL